MKKICLLSALLLSLLTNAQRDKIWGDPHVVEKFAAEAKLNPAYTKLLNQVAGLSKTATRNNTNAAAVRSLLTQNSSLLRGLYTKSGMEAPKPMSAQKKLKVAVNSIYRKSIPWNKYRLANSSMVRTKVPPYDNFTYLMNDAGLSTTKPDTSGSQFGAGTVRMVYESVPPNYIVRRTGQYLQGYEQSFTVPSDPEIIAAEVKLEYSYLYTGWDTYGAIVGMDMALEINSELDGPDYNGLPVYLGPGWTDPQNSNHRWKRVADIYPTDTIESDFGEFHGESNHESFTIGGYVIPGRTFKMKLVMGFKRDTKRGANGSYHYSEFILKKITVTFYKKMSSN